MFWLAAVCFGLTQSRANADCCFAGGPAPLDGEVTACYTGNGAMGKSTIMVLAGTSGSDKAALLAASLIQSPIFGGRVLQVGNHVDFAGAPIFDVTDSTGELNSLGQIGKFFPNGSVDLAKSVQVGFSGDLCGMGSGGVESTFSAKIAFGSVDDQVNLSFSTLSSPTIAGLLTDTFNGLEAGLPASLQGNLSLDTTTGRITFLMPAGVSDAQVCVQGTDTLVVTGLDLTVQPVPEPFSAVLVRVGALSLLGWWGLRHSRQ
jgi:hypothetical protein